MKRLGFTLVEVLVALAIISIAIGASMRATSAALVGSGEIKDRTIARWVGKNELARLQTAQSLPATGLSTGEATQGGIGFSWTASVDNTPNPNFRKVDIAVRRQEGGHTLVTVSGFVVGSR